MVHCPNCEQYEGVHLGKWNNGNCPGCGHEEELGRLRARDKATQDLVNAGRKWALNAAAPLEFLCAVRRFEGDRKMSSEQTAQATSHAILIESLMDCRVAKSERGWAASREITSLRAEVERLTASLQISDVANVYLNGKLVELRAQLATETQRAEDAELRYDSEMSCLMGDCETLQAKLAQVQGALTEIANLDYSNAATNCAAYAAVQIAKKALAPKEGVK